MKFIENIKILVVAVLLLLASASCNKELDNAPFITFDGSANMTIADLAERARRQTAPADTVAKPTVHVTPHDHSGMFDGSLRADRDGEGQDPHDHGFAPVNMPSMHSDKVLNQSLSETPAPQLSAPGFQLSFAPDQLMSAFVMQEVLGKPGGITRE